MARTSLLTVLLVGLIAAPAALAAGPLDTLTVDPGAHSPTVGAVTLKPGIRYSMEISGVFQITGPEGYGFRYDALYCYDGVGFDSTVEPQCPHSGSNDKTNRSSEFLLRVGSSGQWKEADQFGSGIVAYDPNHSYGFSFNAPASGKLEAGGIYAVGDQCKGCQSTVAGGPVVIRIFGPATSGGGGGGTSGGGTRVKVVQPANVTGGPVQCVTARRSLAFAAANGPCPFGQVAVKPAPPTGTATDTSSPKLKAGAKSVTGFINVDQDQVDKEAGWVVDQLDQDTGNRKYRDLFEGCLLFGGAEPEADFLSIKDDRERLVYFVCAQIALGNLKGGSRRVAHTAASACNAVWVPIWKAHSHPTRREYRAVVAAHNRAQKARCRYGANGAMTFSIVARHGTLNRALGGKAKSAYATTGTPKANGLLHYTWNET